MKKVQRILPFVTIIFCFLYMICDLKSLSLEIEHKEPSVIGTIFYGIALVSVFAFFILDFINTKKEKKKTRELLDSIRGTEFVKVKLETNNAYLTTIMNESECLIRSYDGLVEIIMSFSDGDAHIEKTFYMGENDFTNSIELKMISGIEK